MFKIMKTYLGRKSAIFTILAPLAMMVEVVMDLMQPRLLESIIDVGIANQDLGFVYQTGFMMIIAALVGLLGGASCSFFAAFAATDMAANLRQGLFDKIQSFSFLEIDKFKTTSLITRLTNDITQVQTMMVMLLRGAVRAPLLCLGGIVMAVISSPPLAVVFVISLPLLIIATLIILKQSFPLFITVQKRIDRINTVMQESILGVRVIKALTIEENQYDKFAAANDELMNDSVIAQNRNMLLWPIVTLIMNLSIVAILWFGGNMVNQGTLEIGKIMAFVNYLIQIMGSLIMLVRLVLNFSRAKASTDRINEVLDTSPAIYDQTDAQKLNGYEIEFDQVSFRFGHASEDVIKNVSLKIPAGDKVGIIGSTGSGKSTLIHLISRLYDVTKGSIRLGGTDIRNLRLKELRENIGYVLQETILFSGTISDNLKYGNRELTVEKMDAISRDAQAYDFIMSKENGYQGLVEQRGRNFSGGQKQRLSIARTLIKEPKILILDDSTSALDVETEANLQEALNRRMANQTVIMIAQRVSAIMKMDQIIVMDKGEVIAMGKHEQLLEKCPMYRDIALAQLGEGVLANG